MTTGLDPVQFVAPLVNPSPLGLYNVTQWAPAVPEGSAVRWLPSGIDIEPWNFGGGEAIGVWQAAWDATESDLTEEDVKVGVRPERPDPFTPWTIWSEDHTDVTTIWRRDEVRTRASQNLRLQEPLAVERLFTERLLADAGTPAEVDDLVDALGALEEALAGTNVLGMIHASPRWLPRACQANLATRAGNSFKTPGGHTWVFGGGYVEPLSDTLIATSQTFGWQTTTALRVAEDPQRGIFSAIAEKSVLVGYEACIAAAEIDP